MLDVSEMRGAVERVFSNDPKVSTDDLALACRYCATDADCLTVIDVVEDVSPAFRGFLEIALEGHADADHSVSDTRRARLSLRVLINAANRSERVRKSVKPDCVNLWRALARVPDLFIETCASIVAVAKELHVECSLSPDYPILLGELVILWEQSEDRTWLSALFSILLEIDYAFLAHSFADFKPECFTALMRVTETLMDSSETDVVLRVHSNNVLFCVNLLERIMYDIENDSAEPTRLAGYSEQMLYAIEIIGNAALRPNDFSCDLLEKTLAVELITDALEVVLDVQAVHERKEREEAPPRETHHDRPAIPLPARMPRVQTDNRMNCLSKHLLAIPRDSLGNLKCASVRSIGNLCADSAPNRLAAGARGAVITALQCAKIGQYDRPFIMQWSIAAIRHLCNDCSENQDVILSIDQKPTGIIDRDRLFKELGVVVETDPDTGKLRMKRPPAQTP